MPASTFQLDEFERELGKLEEEQSSLSYILDQRNGPLRVEIPQKLFLKWAEIRSRLPDIPFLKLFQHCSSQLPIQVKPDTDRLEERFRVLTSIITSEIRGVKGSRRMKLLEKRRSIYVYAEELVNPSSIRRKMEMLEKENESLIERFERTRPKMRRFIKRGFISKKGSRRCDEKKRRIGI